MSVADVVRSAKDLSPVEWNELIEELREMQTGPKLAPSEAEILQRVHRGMPPKLTQRLEVLRQQSRLRLLTDSEQNELEQIVDRIETAEAERLADLAQLAELQNTSVSHLVRALGIRRTSS